MGGEPSRPDPVDPDAVALEELRRRSGLPLALRILALVGALSFVLIGVNSLLPLFAPSGPPPLPRQEQKNMVRSSGGSRVSSRGDPVADGGSDSFSAGATRYGD